MDILGKIKLINQKIKRGRMKLSDEMHLRIKKGKNFKEIIAEEKNKGKNFKRFMKRLTSLSQSVLYSASFLLFFIVIDVALYALFAPTVYVWAVVLVVAALISSIFASKITNKIKKQQWKYS
jgi:ABC-type protease/lipase transport system fused ATPase/permease subunit